MIPFPLSLAGARHSKVFNEQPRFVWRRFDDGVELEATIVFPDGHSPDAKAPAIFFFHGGLWKMGDATEFTPWAIHLARHGVVSVLLEYRQGQDYDVSSEEIIDDATEAWAWMRQNARALGLDEDKIIAAGSEAGGFMALHLALREEGKRDKNAPPLPVPAALIVFRGLVDCSAKTGLLTACFPQEKEAKKASPIRLVRKGLPPLFLANGGRDRFIPAAPAAKFAKAYGRKKNKIRFLLLDESDQTFYHFNINAPVFEYVLNELLLFLSECGLIYMDVKQDEEMLIF